MCDGYVYAIMGGNILKPNIAKIGYTHKKYDKDAFEELLKRYSPYYGKSFRSIVCEINNCRNMELIIFDSLLERHIEGEFYTCSYTEIDKFFKDIRDNENKEGRKCTVYSLDFN